MQLSAETIAILNNFYLINQNMVIKPGSKLQIINESKSLMASATVAETFDTEIGLCDLERFLTALPIVENPNVEFSTESLTITGSGGQKLVYRCANPSVITAPSKEVKMPTADVTLTLKESDYSSLRRAATVLSLTVLSFEGKAGKKIVATVNDPTNSSANKFSIDLAEEAPFDFSFHFLITNLRLFAGDYKVEISKKLISHWVHSTGKIEYWIALEKNSSSA